MYLLTVFVILVAQVMLQTEAEAVYTCSKHEVLESCAIPCPPTCERPNPPECPTEGCIKGCVCKPGLLRNNITNQCIPPQLCPKDSPRCNGINEVYSDCASYCPETCQTPRREPRACIALCKPGCTCRQEFIRDEISKKCVLRKDCPKCDCGKHAEWTRCGAACIVTCQSLANPKYCPSNQACSPGCVCVSGFILDEKTNKCIPLKKCIEGYNEVNYRPS